MHIESPDQRELDELADRLSQLAPNLESVDSWPHQQLAICAEAGVFRWFIPEIWGGLGWSTSDTMRAYLKLSAGCLTTTFVITQFTGASRRIASSANAELQALLLPSLGRGELFATVGISHLTTSRRHLNQPILRVTKVRDGYVLNGQAPWVTGGRAADWLVVGATLEDGEQILCGVPTDTPGVQPATAVELVGLSASQTGAVNFENCHIREGWLLAGPAENVMGLGSGAGTGGVQTSTLAVGLAQAAITSLEKDAEKRPDLREVAVALRVEQEAIQTDVLRTADGEAICSNEVLRTRANSLVLRSTQAALTAAKGSGYVLGHPTGRWCREALFFLVWSCPQPVMAANLCELAGIE